MKLLQRKFAIPTSAGLMATMNEGFNMGFSFPLMCLLVAGGLGYALIEQWGDVSRMKYGDPSKIGGTPKKKKRMDPAD